MSSAAALPRHRNIYLGELLFYNDQGFTLEREVLHGCFETKRFAVSAETQFFRRYKEVRWNSFLSGDILEIRYVRRGDELVAQKITSLPRLKLHKKFSGNGDE